MYFHGLERKINAGKNWLIIELIKISYQTNNYYRYEFTGLRCNNHIYRA